MSPRLLENGYICNKGQISGIWLVFLTAHGDHTVTVYFLYPLYPHHYFNTNPAARIQTSLIYGQFL